MTAMLVVFMELKMMMMMQGVSVWVMEKKDVERWPKREKELMLELLKRGVAKLTRLRHPRMLTVEHPLEESR